MPEGQSITPRQVTRTYKALLIRGSVRDIIRDEFLEGEAQKFLGDDPPVEANTLPKSTSNDTLNSDE